jgi:hypothetical protein
MQRLYHQTVVYARPVHQSYYVRARPNPVRCCAIYHRRIFICAFVGIAPVETVHQSYYMRVPPNPMRHRAIYHHRIDICTSVVIATVETLHATSLHHQTVVGA